MTRRDPGNLRTRLGPNRGICHLLASQNDQKLLFLVVFGPKKISRRHRLVGGRPVSANEMVDLEAVVLVVSDQG